jgi:hypothetical protein
MFIKILGVFDLITGGILIFGQEFHISKLIFLVFGFVLLLKSSLGLLKDFASWIDFLAGICLLTLIIIQIPVIICAVIGLLIIQKSIFSFL